MTKKQILAKLLVFSLAILFLLSACGKNNISENGSSEASQGDFLPEEGSSQEQQLDHRFELAQGEEVFVPSLWLVYGGFKSSISLNSAFWKTDNSTDEKTILSGYSPLFSTERLDPIDKIANENKAMLSFSFEPKSVVIHRWSGEYIGMSDKSEDFEEVALDEFYFTIEENSIYEISAEFENARASYLLYIK